MLPQKRVRQLPLKMPTELEHIDKWRHNRAFLESIPERFSDWAATCAFYAALHAVEAFLWAKYKRDCHTHEQRDPVVQRELSAVYAEYSHLYNVSRLARYMVAKGIPKTPLFSRFMPRETVVNVLIRQKLHRLEQHVIKELALSLDQFPELFPPNPLAPAPVQAPSSAARP